MASANVHSLGEGHLPTEPDILNAPNFRDVAGDVGRRAARPLTAEAPPVTESKSQNSEDENEKIGRQKQC